MQHHPSRRHSCVHHIFGKQRRILTIVIVVVTAITIATMGRTMGRTVTVGRNTGGFYSGARRAGQAAKPYRERVVDRKDRLYGAPLNTMDGRFTVKQTANTVQQQRFNQYYAAAATVAEQAVRGRHLGKPGAFNPATDSVLCRQHLVHLGEPTTTQVWDVVVAMRQLLTYNTNSEEHKQLRAEWVQVRGMGSLCTGDWLLNKIRDLAKWCPKYFVQ